MAKSAPHTGQGVLLPPAPFVERLNRSNGVVRLEDLDWPFFDPEQKTTMADYIGEIGARMAEIPRESSVKDEPLHLFRDDFKLATPANLKRGLYPKSGGKWPKPGVLKITEWYTNLDKKLNPGMVSFSQLLTASEDDTKLIVKHAPAYANEVDNTTQRANQSDLDIEGRVDLGGESVVYAFAEKHLAMKERMGKLLWLRAFPFAAKESVSKPNQPQRVEDLEYIRLRAFAVIKETVRIACRGLGYGTNRTQSAVNSAASNMTRSENPGQWLVDYSDLAMSYNDALRGKFNQSMWGCMQQIYEHREQLFNNIDREYTDD